jgi:nitroreductase
MTQNTNPGGPTTLDLLHRRRSVPSRLLGPPAPTDEQLAAWLGTALRVPDHGKLVPWRFLLIRNQARVTLGERLAQTLLRRDPEATEAALAKERARFAHAPLVVTVVARILKEHRIPACEQLLSAGCVCFSLLLAAEAEGFGAQWLTGWAAYDPEVAAALGLAADETVVGFIHIGTPRERIAERERPALETLLSEWQG